MFRVDQQDVDGKWWPGGPHHDAREQAQREVDWLDCPGRIVEVTS